MIIANFIVNQNGSTSFSMPKYPILASMIYLLIHLNILFLGA